MPKEPFGVKGYSELEEIIRGKQVLLMQAKATLRVNEEILSNGKWPNGRPLTEDDRLDIEADNEEWRAILKFQPAPFKAVIKALRQRTGATALQCRTVLELSNFNFERAIKRLKRGSRTK